MYKTIFQNSKAALVFAVMTIIGAVMMVGSPEDEGSIDKTIGRFSQTRETIAKEASDFAGAQSVPDKVIDPDAGWGSSKSAMFGDYQSADASVGDGGTANSPIVGPIAAPAAAQRVKAGGIVPGPQPIVADNVGTPVPGFDDGSTVASPPPVAVITSRKMTLEPK